MTEKLTSTALVTGGSRGIGKAIALRLAHDGYQIFLTYVSKPEQAEEVCKTIHAQGGKASCFKIDVSDWDQVREFFKNEIKKKVSLDVLVNNAGITKDGLIMRMKPEQWQQVLDVNLGGCFVCLQQAAVIMMKQRYGRIINITSVVGQRGNAGQANYAASKAGVIGLTKTAAQELAGRSITVNAVAPGFIETDMTSVLPDEVKEKFLSNIPAGTLGTPEDIAEAVAFFASPKAGYINGQILGVNGGMY
ncbi:3-oxoacyl-[acyl-carrier-protein] reductase [Desulfoplanes sp. PS50]|jgi:3-oxoacyl-[acyl-carrier protein] reductase